MNDKDNAPEVTSTAYSYLHLYSNTTNKAIDEQIAAIIAATSNPIAYILTFLLIYFTIYQITILFTMNKVKHYNITLALVNNEERTKHQNEWAVDMFAARIKAENHNPGYFVTHIEEITD